MIVNMTGGMGLDFAITAYLDETAMLADAPGLNTIGVVSDVDFSSWAFAQEEPRNPEEGMLWFLTGDPTYCDAPFSAVAGNQIMVYPLSAFQYRSGSWEEISVRSYQEKDGAAKWVEWIRQTVWLVKDGLLKVTFETDARGFMTVTQEDGGVNFYSSTNGGHALVPLDLTNYSKLVIEGTKFSAHNSEKMGAWEPGVTPSSTNAAAATSFGNTAGKTALDVSDLSGVYNVGLYLLGGATYNAVATEFYLTRK